MSELMKTVQRISSREVAEMMECRHTHLIRKIENHSGILEKVTEPNFGLSDLWIRSSYKDSTGRELKEYQVTKKGCEFLAHKTTGEKGDLFTIRYMNKFEEMKQTLQQLSTPSYMIENPIERAKMWIKEQEEKLQLEGKVGEQQAQLDEQAPKVKYHDKVLHSDKLITTTDIAKDLGMSARMLHSILHGKNIIFKQGKSWMLYSKYQDRVPEYCDYDISEFGQILKWTEKGRRWIIDVLEK